MTSELLITEPPIQVSPTLARELGLNGAIVLQQIHYWLNLQFSRCLIEDHYWVRYIPKHWGRQFSFWDSKTLHRAIHQLEKLEVLVAWVDEGSDEATYYTIDYSALSKVTSSSDAKVKDSPSLPTYDHANFDAINLDECKRDNQ